MYCLTSQTRRAMMQGCYGSWVESQEDLLIERCMILSHEKSATSGRRLLIVSRGRTELWPLWAQSRVTSFPKASFFAGFSCRCAVLYANSWYCLLVGLQCLGRIMHQNSTSYFESSLVVGPWRHITFSQALVALASLHEAFVLDSIDNLSFIGWSFCRNCDCSLFAFEFYCLIILIS